MKNYLNWKNFYFFGHNAKICLYFYLSTFKFRFLFLFGIEIDNNCSAVANLQI